MRAMTLNDKGITRAQLRIGSGKGIEVADDHVHELLGSEELYIYVTPGIRPKGYDGLKTYLEREGCEVRVSDTAPMLPAPGYKAIRITAGGRSMSDAVLKRSHRWAHKLNYLHSFFKPIKRT